MTFSLLCPSAQDWPGGFFPVGLAKPPPGLWKHADLVTASPPTPHDVRWPQRGPAILEAHTGASAVLRELHRDRGLSPSRGWVSSAGVPWAPPQDGPGRRAFTSLDTPSCHRRLLAPDADRSPGDHPAFRAIAQEGPSTRPCWAGHLPPGHTTGLPGACQRVRSHTPTRGTLLISLEMQETLTAST